MKELRNRKSAENILQKSGTFCCLMEEKMSGRTGYESFDRTYIFIIRVGKQKTRIIKLNA